MNMNSWTPAESDSLPEGPHASFLQALSETSAGHEPRVLKSVSGQIAIVVDRPTFDSCSKLTLSITGAVESIAICLDFDASTSIQRELVGLAADEMCIAVPQGLAVLLSKELSSCGEVSQDVLSTAPATLVVLRGRGSKKDMLLKNAPVDLGETEDNLRARERWFQKRESSDS